MTSPDMRKGSLALLSALLLSAAGHPLLAVTQEATPEDLFKAGAAAFASGDFAGASKNFEAVLSAGPTGEALETILFTLASTYYNQKDLKKAEEYYNRCLKEFPNGRNSTKALIALSQIQNQTGRKAEAEKTLAKACEGQGDLPARARLARASLMAEQGKPAEAADVIRPMIAGGIRDDLSVQAAMSLAELDAKSGNLQEALKVLDQLRGAQESVDNPLQLDYLAIRIGDALLSKGDRKGALRMYASVRPRETVIALQKERTAALEKRISDNRASLQTNPKAFMEINAANASLQKDLEDLRKALDQFQKAPDTVTPLRIRQAKAYDELDRKWESLLIWESLLESGDPKIREDALFSIGAAYCSLGRPDEAVEALDRYISEYPAGKYAGQAGYLKGAVALESGNYAKAETLFGDLIDKGTSAAIAADMQFLLANTEFARAADAAHPEPAKYKEAVQDYEKYLAKYPDGKFAEECRYRIPLCWFQLGDYGKALEGFRDYEKKFPSGTFAGDCGYRIALCHKAAEKHDDVIRLCDEWLAKHAGEQMVAEVYALRGEAYAAKEMHDDAAESFRKSVNAGGGDEILKYSLQQAVAEYQKTGNWDGIASLCSSFAEKNPSHPAAIGAVYWVAKARIKEGKAPEAKSYMAAAILANIGNRNRDSVELLITQLAQTCSKRPRAPLTAGLPSPSQAPGGEAPAPTPRPSPTPLPPYDADADFAKYLNDGNCSTSPLALARLRFGKAKLADFTKRADRGKELMVSIGRDFKPDQLSAQLLAECGDIALEEGDAGKAETFYRELMESFPTSDLLESAYYGMGAAALARNQPAEALRWFDDAVAKTPAETRLGDITFGKGRALLALGRTDDARKTLEQVASNKEWRGELTAKALLALGDLEESRGNTAAAIQYYQRVFVAYQRYPSAVIPAYLRAADGFVKLGQPDKAAAHLRELLAKPRLAQSPLADDARKKLESLPQPAPAPSPEQK